MELVATLKKNIPELALGLSSILLIAYGAIHWS